MREIDRRRELRLPIQLSHPKGLDDADEQARGKNAAYS
jgi:hypothetical protein